MVNENVDKLIETFEKRKNKMNLYHHFEQIDVQKKDYEVLSKIVTSDVGKYPLFKLVSWIIPFKNGIPHMFTLMKYGSYAKKCILEIGTCHGASVISFGIGAKMYGGGDPKLVTVDIIQPDDEAKGYLELFKEFLPSNRSVVQSDSKLFNFNEPVDLLFIDGSHEFEDVYADCKKYIPLVVNGGICIFHDTGSIDVSRGIAKFLDENDGKIKYEKIKDDLINNDNSFMYNNVGISIIRILENF